MVLAAISVPHPAMTHPVQIRSTRATLIKTCMNSIASQAWKAGLATSRPDTA